MPADNGCGTLERRRAGVAARSPASGDREGARLGRRASGFELPGSSRLSGYQGRKLSACTMLQFVATSLAVCRNNRVRMEG
jgi:hypothetical protein